MQQETTDTRKDKTRLEFFSRTDEVWEAIYQDCLTARESIEFEQYMLEDDPVGRRFLRLFADKARQGLSVKLMLDAVGSRSILSLPLIEEIRKAGGIVHFYNRIDWRKLFNPSSWLPRNHNKIMLIDSKVGHIGSVCLSDSMRFWKDAHVRFTGPLTQEVKKDFARIWTHRWRKPKFRHDPHAAKEPFRYVVSEPRLMPSPIYRELLAEIHKARRSVFLVSPYFLPPMGLRRALRAAVRRGVDVRIMMSEKTDVWLADRVIQSYYPGLLRHGMRIFLYKSTVLHAKYAVIDDSWATIGSTNMDYLSLLQNREANIIIRQPESVAELRARFCRYLQDCLEVGISYCRDIPFFYRIIGTLGRYMRRVL